MGKRINRQKYIHDFARTVMGQLGIRSLDFRKENSAADIARTLAKEYWIDVGAYLTNRHSDSTCGKLASCGVDKGDRYIAERHNGVLLHEVVGELIFSEYRMGCVILLQTAAAALLAAMADNIWADINRT